MSTLAILGGTGGLGRHLVRRALAADHAVRTLVRSPARLALSDDRLEVVQGDIADAQAIDSVVEGADAVLWAVGYSKGQDPSVYGDGMRHLVQSMGSQGCRRLVAISGAGLELPGDTSGLGRRMIITMLKLFAGKVLQGKQHEREALRGADLDWTLVRVARMVEREPRGAVRVDRHQVSGSPMVAYADVADWMLEQVDDDSYLREAPFVSGA